jgi:hypothetical protein
VRLGRTLPAGTEDGTLVAEIARRCVLNDGLDILLGYLGCDDWRGGADELEGVRGVEGRGHGNACAAEIVIWAVEAGVARTSDGASRY